MNLLVKIPQDEAKQRAARLTSAIHSSCPENSRAYLIGAAVEDMRDAMQAAFEAGREYERRNSSPAPRPGA